MKNEPKNNFFDVLNLELGDETDNKTDLSLLLAPKNFFIVTFMSLEYELSAEKRKNNQDENFVKAKLKRKVN